MQRHRQKNKGTSFDILFYISLLLATLKTSVTDSVKIKDFLAENGKNVPPLRYLEENISIVIGIDWKVS